MRALITGAASGIGLAVAERLNSEALARGETGAHLVLVDVNADALGDVADDLARNGAKVLCLASDLVDPNVPGDAVAQAVATFGGLDAIVSNAGVAMPGALLDLTIEEYESTFAINTRPTWLLAKAAFEHLAKTRGAMVVTASITGHHPAPTLGAYSISKAALMMMVRQIASDWGRHGIRINSVSPGSTLTGIIERSNTDLSVTEPGGAPGRNPLGFISAPRDQASIISYLLSEEARFITGADFVVDGGLLTQLLINAGKPPS